jgi:hypothetical protein
MSHFLQGACLGFGLVYLVGGVATAQPLVTLAGAILFSTAAVLFAWKEKP